MRETTIWPFVEARWKTTPESARRVRVIVIHDMEAPEKGSTAEDVAQYFATTDRPASAHVCVDNDSVVQCVYDADIAYGAPGCNADGIHVELAGYGSQSRDQWLDAYSTAMLDRAARVVAEYLLKYELPTVHLTDAQLAAGAKGIVGHVQVSTVYKKSDHQDPGPNFPWDAFMSKVITQHAALRDADGAA